MSEEWMPGGDVPEHLRGDQWEEAAYHAEQRNGTSNPTGNVKHDAPNEEVGVQSERESATSDDVPRTRPKLDTGCQDLALVTPEALEHLQAGNDPPRLFRYGHLPSRLERDDNSEPVLKPLTLDRMRHEMARASNWIQIKKQGNNEVEIATFPPKEVVADALATPDLPFPVLRRIVECPVFAADGTLHETSGYRPESMRYYQPADGFCCPEVPKDPTHQDIVEAAALLSSELLGDFPFTGEAERAHAIAALLLPFARDMISGPTPLHLIEKPSPGTGATLMVDALFYPATGRPVAAITEGRDEDEWRKRLFAKLRSGPTVVNFDNLRRRLDTAALSSAITAYPAWEDRVLGISEMVRVPVTCVWIATGNNPALSHEMIRRTVRIRLDAKIDRPWLRTGFRHPNLRVWMQSNRGRLVRAALTLIRGWIVRGRPPGKIALGMFESWSETLGGILETAGITGFLSNLEELYEEADTETAGWRTFVALWWERFKDAEKGVSELWPLANQDGLLHLGDGKEHSQQIRLGMMLRANRDRVFTVKEPGTESELRLRLERGEAVRRAVQWRLQSVR